MIVNALQRRADVVVQKGLAEGFGPDGGGGDGEARLVVASAVGGDPKNQHRRTVRAVRPARPDDLEGFAEPPSAPGPPSGMGHHARERVRGAFLGARHLEQYVECSRGIAGGEGPTGSARRQVAASRPLR